MAAVRQRQTSASPSNLGRPGCRQRRLGGWRWALFRWRWSVAQLGARQDDGGSFGPTPGASPAPASAPFTGRCRPCCMGPERLVRTIRLNGPVGSGAHCSPAPGPGGCGCSLGRQRGTTAAQAAAKSGGGSARRRAAGGRSGAPIPARPHAGPGAAGPGPACRHTRRRPPADGRATPGAHGSGGCARHQVLQVAARELRHQHRQRLVQPLAVGLGAERELAGLRAGVDLGVVGRRAGDVQRRLGRGHGRRRGPHIILRVLADHRAAGLPRRALTDDP